MVRARVVTGEHLFVIDVRTRPPRPPQTETCVAHIARVIAAGGAEVRTPILVAEYWGQTPGQALDRALEAARRTFGVTPTRTSG